MFVIEGMDKVRKVIEENRKRKLTKHKKISNNTIIEIDYCSPLEIRKLPKNLMQIAQGEDIGFVYGKGKHKPEIQKLYEELEECGTRLMEYKACFEIMGKGHNSYSKTDMEATFMRMKEECDKKLNLVSPAASNPIKVGRLTARKAQFPAGYRSVGKSKGHQGANRQE